MTDLKMLPLLEDARARIERGWVQGHWYKGDLNGEVTHVCAKTALVLAEHGGVLHCIGVTTLPSPSPLANDAERFLMRIVNRKRVLRAATMPVAPGCHCVACTGMGGFDSLPSFNDSMLTTKKDVLAVFDEGIAMLRAEQTKMFEKEMAEQRAMWAAALAEIDCAKFNYVVGDKPVIDLSAVGKPVSRWTLASTASVVMHHIKGSVTEPVNA